jgi:hypothetical protein
MNSVIKPLFHTTKTEMGCNIRTGGKKEKKKISKIKRRIALIELDSNGVGVGSSSWTEQERGSSISVESTATCT